MGDGQFVNGHAKIIVAVSAVLSVLAILTVFLRFYARTYKAKKYYTDDYLCVVALVRPLDPPLLSRVPDNETF